MIKLALTITTIVAAVWFVGYYRLGEKPLIGHIEEIYGTPVVQQKIDALQKGVGEKLNGHKLQVEKSADKKSKARPMAAIEPAVVDVRPPAAPEHKAHDALNESDREGLNDLLSKKLIEKVRARGSAASKH